MFFTLDEKIRKMYGEPRTGQRLLRWAAVVLLTFVLLGSLVLGIAHLG